MNRSLQSKAIAEGALMAVITALLAVAGLYIPFMQFIVFFVWALPCVLVIMRHGPTTGIISIIVAGILILLLAGPMRATFSVIQFGSLALIYGVAFRKRWSAGKTVVSGSVVMIVSTLLLYYLVFLLTGLNNLNIAGQLHEAIEPTIELYKNLGLISPENGASEEQMRELITWYIRVFTIFLPAFFIVSGIATAFLNFFAAQKILARFEIKVPEFPLFRCWRLPWWIVWGFIIGFGLNLLGQYQQNNNLSIIGNNIMLVYAPVLFVLGLSVISYLIHKYLGDFYIYRILLIISILFFLPFTATLLCVIGLLDLLFNYRRLSGEY